MTRQRLKVCAQPRCPELTTGRHCPAHASEYERQRGTPTQRGYGQRHRVLRARWKPKVERGEVDCARCRTRIWIGQEWALDHTDDRTGYLGPSHRSCNNRAGGQAAHR